MVDMIATKKLKYGTRRLTAGDPFEARHDRDARLLIGIGKARYATRPLVAAAEPVAPAPTIPSDGLRMVRHSGPCPVDLSRGSRSDERRVGHDGVSKGSLR